MTSRSDGGPMRVLVACEYSGIVRDAFRQLGHDAYSCDIKAPLNGGPHLRGDVRNYLGDGWDLMIAHPPCTYLAKGGNRWINAPGRAELRALAVEFVKELYAAPIPCIAIENPIGQLSKLWRKPDQIICPSEFGHDVTKATCLWLKNLPPLMATLINPFAAKNWTEKVNGPNREEIRSRTFHGVAAAMAAQWRVSELSRARAEGPQFSP